MNDLTYERMSKVLSPSQVNEVTRRKTEFIDFHFWHTRYVFISNLFGSTRDHLEDEL